MRIARILDAGVPRYAVVHGDGGEAWLELLAGGPTSTPSGERRDLTGAKLLAPVTPAVIVCVGKNYAAHAAEMGTEAPSSPVVFLKPPGSIVGPGEPIRWPRDAGRVDFEGELAVVIAATARDVPPARAAEVILGYTCANDVTARDQQRADGQWTRAKGHDTFCPLGPWITTDLDPTGLSVTTRVDGVVRQQAPTSQLIHSVAELIAFVTGFMTLRPGDVLLTGTPAGVGPLRPGELVEVEIPGIGVLANPVVAR